MKIMRISNDYNTPKYQKISNQNIGFTGCNLPFSLDEIDKIKEINIKM